MNEFDTVFVEEADIKSEPMLYDENSGALCENVIDQSDERGQKIGQIFFLQSKKWMLCCIFCEFRSQSIADFIKHVEDHVEVRGFLKMVPLPGNELIQTNARRFYCPICNRGFSDRSNLGRHKRNLHKDHPYTSVNPDSTIPMLNMRTFHEELQKTPEKNVKTSFSIQTLGDTVAMKEDANDRRKFICTICTLGYSEKSNLCRHRREAHGISNRQRTDTGSDEQQINSQSALIAQDVFNTTESSEQSNDHVHFHDHESKVSPSWDMNVISTPTAISRPQQRKTNNNEQWNPQIESVVLNVLSTGAKSEQPQEQQELGIEDDEEASSWYKNDIKVVRKFYCSICNRGYTDKSNLCRHKRKTHGNLQSRTENNDIEKPQPIQQNSKTEKLETDRAVETKLNWKLYRCSICKRVFPNRSNCNRHLKIHRRGNRRDGQVEVIRKYLGVKQIINAPKRIECSICDRSFSDFSSMYRHRRGAHQMVRQSISQDKTFTNLDGEKCRCNLCDKVYDSLRAYQKHHSFVHAKRKFTCDHCKKGFPLMSLLRKHMEIHSAEMKYICEYCGMCFNSYNNLQGHRARHENPGHRLSKPQQKFKCTICGAIRSQNYYKSHMLRHTGTKDFRCTVCCKQFYDRYQLKMHSVTHSDLRRFQCNLCPSSYKIRHKLVMHLRTHTGEYIYRCATCTKGFSEKRSMMRHIELRKCIAHFNTQST